MTVADRNSAGPVLAPSGEERATLASLWHTSRPSVSVVIPAYNAAAHLAEALQSLLDQTLPPTEIIVIDDGSTDQTASVLARFGASIVSFRQANGGLASARMNGVARATGDFIALFDADDICEPDRLAIQTAYLQATPEVQLVSTDFSAFNAQGLVGTAYRSRYYSAIARLTAGNRHVYPVEETFDAPYARQRFRSLRTARGDVYDKLMEGNFVHPPTVMFRRNVLDQAGNFSIEAGSMCDWDWILRVAKTGQLGFIAADLVRYRLSPTQMSSARYGYGRALANMQVLRRLQARDPEAWARNRRQFFRKLGSYSLDAADAICETDRRAGLSWLVTSIVRFQHWSRRSFIVAVKLALPSVIRGKVVQLKNRAAGT